jgi:hypothetical protein
LGIQIAIVSGCGSFSSGKNDYERFQQVQTNFINVIVGAGGSASQAEQSMAGFKITGWTINLRGGKVTDAIIEKIIEAARGAPVLDLNLSRTAITDAQLAKLDKAGVLAKTVNLDLSETKISDAGLDQINAVIALTTLNLKGSSATKEGAERLGNRKIANPQTPPPFKKQPEVTI